MKEHDWTKILGWPGYRVYQTEIDEKKRTLRLWVRRKKSGLKLICSNRGQHVPADTIVEISQREVRDLPCFQYRTTRMGHFSRWRLRKRRSGIPALHPTYVRRVQNILVPRKRSYGR